MANTFPLSIKTEVSITKGQIINLLSCALEGGINYWATYRDAYPHFPEDLTLYTKGVYSGLAVYAIDHPLYSILISDIESNKQYKIDLGKLKEGIESMSAKFPRHFRNFIQDNYDAETGDVFIQCCVFGDIIYG